MCGRQLSLARLLTLQTVLCESGRRILRHLADVVVRVTNDRYASLLLAVASPINSPGGSITFLPKIHGPVSTTTKLPPAQWVASSTSPTLPSRASTLNPLRSTFGGVAIVNVHISIVAITTTPSS